MVSVNDILKRRQEILQAAARHGAGNVRLFGSLVRGQAAEGSDIDLLVHMDDDRSLLDLIALTRELEEILGCPVDVVSDEGLHHLLRERVAAEEVSL